MISQDSSRGKQQGQAAREHSGLIWIPLGRRALSPTFSLKAALSSVLLTMFQNLDFGGAQSNHSQKLKLKTHQQAANVCTGYALMPLCVTNRWLRHRC